MYTVYTTDNLTINTVAGIRGNIVPWQLISYLFQMKISSPEEHAAYIEEPAAYMEELAAYIEEPAAYMVELAAYMEEHAAYIEEPAAYMEELAAYMEEPAAYMEIVTCISGIERFIYEKTL